MEKIELMEIKEMLANADFIAGLKAGIKLAKSHVHESEEDKLINLEWDLDQEIALIEKGDL